MNETTDAGTLPDLPPHRRRVLGWLAKGFLSLWGLGFLWVTNAFLKPPRSRRSITQRVISLGPLESLPVGQALVVRHGRDPIFVIRRDEAALVSLSGVCTHLRCVLNWDRDQQVLACPCHNGSFDLSGNVLSGPPQRPLTRHRVETRLGQMYLHV
jgi:cytochrome b6-f complex iron-sulfur subunit